MHTHVRYRWIWLLLLLLLGGGIGWTQTARARQDTPPPDDPFRVRWERADGAVVDGEARSWLWGPAPLATLDESGLRVQYWDKGRMEQAGVDLADPWAITGGLVGRDLLDARATLPIVGDDDPALNPLTPTYADLAERTLPTPMLDSVGAVDVLLSPDGTPLMLADLASAYTETRAVALDTGEAFAIPQVFWDLFQTIEQTTGTPWLVPIGHALSAPSWTLTEIDGQLREVLIQVYERRVLTYTPQNPPGWRVELGNVGRHAYMWRYTDAPTRTRPVPPLPAAQDAAIDPQTGPVGTPFTVSMWGFAPDEPVSLWLTTPTQETHPLADAPETVWGDGSLVVTVTACDQPGVWAITGQGSSSGHQAFFVWTVQP